MRISVVMCTYNGARFLPEQLESIAAQTEIPCELVICDDRSSDESVEIIESFLRRVLFPTRLEINDINRGSTKNFEKAIGLCRGDIIVLADQDDIWCPQKLSCLAEVFARDKAVGAVFSDAFLIDEDSRAMSGTLWQSYQFNSSEQTKFAHGHGLKILLKHPVVTGATMAFRSEFRNLVLPVPHGHVHDRWLSLLIASVSRIVPIPSPLIHYRKHADQQIGLCARTFSDKLNLAINTTRSSYLEEVRRWRDVIERLCTSGAKFRAHQGAIDLFRQTLCHREVRGSLPQSRLSRLPFLLKEAVSLRYWRYSNGLSSVAKDLLM